jgi:hypothetical protein
MGAGNALEYHWITAAIRDNTGNAKKHTVSLLIPINQALNQLIKGCQLAIYNAVILASENRKV